MVDLVPQFLLWQSRIKIGRFADRNSWEKKVLNITKQWVNRTPTVKLTDNNRFILLDILRGKYRRSTIQSWQEAALFLGLTEHWKKTKEHRQREQLEKFTAGKLDASGMWKHMPTEVDETLLAYAFLNSEFLSSEKIRPAMDSTFGMLQNFIGEDGTIAYKQHCKDFRFVDTVGFVCPFLVLYGVKFRNSTAVDLGVKQILEYQKFGMMYQENIPCHTYNINTKMPTGLFGWGRGLGWFLIGLADSWKILPYEHPSKKELEEIMVRTAKSVIKFQETNGGFHWLLFDPASRLDSSAAATTAYFFSVAEEIPEIRETCSNAKEKALNYLQSVTRRNGAIDFSQGDTKAIGIYAQTFDVLPFTQGFALRCLFV